VSDVTATATETTNDAPLSMSEGIAAFAATQTEPEPEEEAEQGQSEAEEGTEGAEAEDEVSDEETETEGEPEDEGQAEEEETEDEPESERGRYVAHDGRVKLADGTEVTVNDLIQGNLRDRDYRQKTMELAENRKAFEAQSSAFKQREQIVEQQREQLVEIINSIVPPEPDPSMVNPSSANYDPVAYMAQKANRDQWVAHLQKLDADKREAAERGQAETAQQRQQKSVQAQEALIEAVPEFKNDPTGKKLDAFYADVRDFGKQYGFTTEELVNGIGYDHRMALVMRKAIAFDKLQAAKPKVQGKTETRPPVQRGSKRVAPAEQKARQVNAAMERLNSSGKLSDGVAALLALERKG
jgi:hypothetical protein